MMNGTMSTSVDSVAYDHPARRMVEHYFNLIRNLSDEDKIELIARISNSMLHNKKEDEMKAKEKILFETYGSFQSSKTADEIIDDIHQSRHFREKDINL